MYIIYWKDCPGPFQPSSKYARKYTIWIMTKDGWEPVYDVNNTVSVNHFGRGTNIEPFCCRKCALIYLSFGDKH
jgi:hypothetical protein